MLTILADSDFRFKPLNEQERVSDVLVKNELFETDKFDRDFLVKGDLHRISEKNRWISPRGFALNDKRGSDSVPVSARHSIMKDGFRTTRQTFMNTIETEPYEDPSLNPGFVRSTREYLR